VKRRPDRSPSPESYLGFRVGARVRLHGLVVQKQLNDSYGTVLKPDPLQAQKFAGSVKFRLDSTAEVAAKPQNLELVSDGSQTGPRVLAPAVTQQSSWAAAPGGLVDPQQAALVALEQALSAAEGAIGMGMVRP